MKFYYIPGSSSLAVHIALIEAGVYFEPIRVDMVTKKLDDGSDFHVINHQGTVPVLEFENGERLTEVAAVLQYVADLTPEKRLAPAGGTFERSRLHESLGFIATEIHKSWSQVFNPRIDKSSKAIFVERLQHKYGHLDSRLANGGWVTGDSYSVADMYLFVTTSWRSFIPIDLPGLRHVDSFIQRMKERPAVQAAMKAEGLI
ncbi:glutathione S-transferase [Rhizobium sp. BK226]|uniref:glutathione S-transferase family protein n=1 Tax=Rhizobium sp. BK226 TaxID=2587075 RepID=UPI00161281F6|nr:glutathione S-transferase family protein [Rhizobium sp. BK226]MBB4116502.1 glutathione S-transferase [Rhizobium sp. BK226]